MMLWTLDAWDLNSFATCSIVLTEPTAGSFADKTIPERFFGTNRFVSSRSILAIFPIFVGIETSTLEGSEPLSFLLIGGMLILTPLLKFYYYNYLLKCQFIITNILKNFPIDLKGMD